MYGRLITSRKVATAMYLAYMIGGILFFAEQSGLFADSAEPVMLYIWHLFLAVGGLIGAVGAWLKRFSIEAVGIPLLGSALVAYILVLIVAGIEEGGSVSFGLASLLMGAGLGLVDRGLRAWQLVTIADRIDRRGS